MTEDHAPLTGADLIKGTPVMYTGPDNPQLISPSAAITVLRKGHPGRILDPDWHHIRVEWVRLEDEPISYGAGFCLERTAEQPDGYVPGLVRISESQYEDLALQLRS
ncbi:hypothetical protein [Rhodococcus pyridinivorans]|uniref:hypothetical protein n=1 Tax=Rhodococcus pyridinivorans TaxID=103816 RepID=UPI00265B5799|nr:hypothetical protein [Rhodococcus pyridinivorans]